MVYDPEKAAEKRAELAEKLREEKGIEEGKPLFISYSPELENGYVRSPEDDVVELSSNNTQPKFIAAKEPMIMAKMSPVEVIGWIEVIDKGYRVLKPVFIDMYDAIFGGKNDPEATETDNSKPSFEEMV